MIRHQEEGLTIFESALFRTTTTVFYNRDLLLLVDPNWLPEEVQTIRKYIDGILEGRALYLLFTHSDYDHIIADGAFPEARTIATQAFVDNPKSADILRQIREFDESYYLRRDYPILYPNIDIVVQSDGQELRIGETTLRFYLAPGHNPDGMITEIAPQGIWLLGDYLSNIEFPYVYHSFAEYRATIYKVAALLKARAFHLLIPGHGDSTAEPEDLEQRIKDTFTYLDDLEKSLRSGQAFDLEALWQRYDFPAGMLPFHQANIKLLRTELGL